MFWQIFRCIQLLEELYGDLCCSDADYGDITYYDIVESNKKRKNG